VPNSLIVADQQLSLEGKLDDHLGYGKHDPADRNGGNSRNVWVPETLSLPLTWYFFWSRLTGITTG
jgi:hypothetical protein